MRFVHDNLPQRLIFGSGEAAAHLATEIRNHEAARGMVIGSRREMDTADGITGHLRVLLRHDDVVMHVPTEVAACARDSRTPRFPSCRPRT